VSKAVPARPAWRVGKIGMAVVRGGGKTRGGGLETLENAVAKRQIYTFGWHFVFRNWTAKF